MIKRSPLTLVIFFAVVLSACSRKTQPASSVVKPVEKNEPAVVESAVDTSVVALKVDSIAVAKKPVPKPKAKPAAVPKVIVVSDKAASKSVDGRYYYDLQGHRYWRNNKDGKYYLYHKSMNNDEAFKKPN